MYARPPSALVAALLVAACSGGEGSVTARSDAGGPRVDGGSAGSACASCSGGCTAYGCVTTMGSGHNIALTPEYVLWDKNGTALVATAPGGATTTLLPEITVPDFLGPVAVDDRMAYGFANAPATKTEMSYLEAAPLVGGAIVTLLSMNGIEGKASLVAAGSNLYWGTSAEPPTVIADLWVTPKDGGTSALFESECIGDTLASDGTSIYYIGAALALERLDPPHSSPVTLATVPPFGPSAPSLRVDASRVYWSSGSLVLSVSKLGGPISTILRATADIATIVLYDADIYWSTAAQGGTVYAQPLAGGPVVTVLSAEPSSGSSFFDFDVGATGLYWSTNGRGQGTLGLLMRLAPR